MECKFATGQQPGNDTMTIMLQASQNRLLASLPQADLDRLMPYFERVNLALGQVIHESGCKLGYVYFPANCIVSILYMLEDGDTAEVAVVGFEGIIGIPLLMGGETTTTRAVVQSAGFAYRIAAHKIKTEFSRGGPVMRLLLRYTQALMTQMTQTAVCNRHHTIEQQLCRWLLLSLDRLPSNTLTMTQDLIANMLGVRRGGVTEAAGKLQRAGVIRYVRGRIDVLDRPALEARACECYSVVKVEFKRLLAEIPPGDPYQVLGVSRPERRDSHLAPVQPLAAQAKFA